LFDEHEAASQRTAISRAPIRIAFSGLFGFSRCGDYSSGFFATTLVNTGTPKARAQIFAKTKWLSIDNFWVGAATVAKIAGKTNVKADIAIKGEGGKPVYLYQSAAAEKIVDPQGRINHVMLYPTEAN
jgi:hypothetical protein